MRPWGVPYFPPLTSICLFRAIFAVATTKNDTSYFGPITGRVGQRISRGRFVLDGEVYHLERNDGKNTLHGIDGRLGLLLLLGGND